MKNIFKKGLILGGILAAVAAFGFVFTREAKEFSDDTKEHLKKLAKQMKKHLHSMEDVTKESFSKMVATSVDEYADKKELAKETKEELQAILEAMWKDVEDEYVDATSDEEKK
jgi:gas vesicle protein